MNLNEAPQQRNESRSFFDVSADNGWGQVIYTPPLAIKTILNAEYTTVWYWPVMTRGVKLKSLLLPRGRVEEKK